MQLLWGLLGSPHLQEEEVKALLTWWKTSNWMSGVESVSDTGWVGKGSVLFISGVREIIPTVQFLSVSRRDLER